ncbi:hypothetical protein ACROYT_G020990 [Oculina patagonica]
MPTAAEMLRYRETTVDSTVVENVGREVNISRASVHRYTNIFIDESRPFIPGASLPVYRGVPLFYSCLLQRTTFFSFCCIRLSSNSDLTMPCIALFCNAASLGGTVCSQ